MFETKRVIWERVASFETAKEVIARVSSVYGNVKAYSPPYALGGNYRVLELRPDRNHQITLKVEGPEHIVMELFQFWV